MRKQTTLLQRFSIVTLVMTVVISVLLAIQVTSSIEQTALDSARNDLAEVIRTRQPFWLQMSDPRGEFARTHEDPQDYAAWKTRMDAIFTGYAVYRIKVWNSSSQVIWSDDPALIGQKYPDNDELREALDGTVKSELTNLSKLENTDDQVEGKALELYVPILPMNSFDVIGVVEVYQEVGDMYETIGFEQRDAVLLIAGLMSAFYIILFSMIANASRTLSRLQRIAQLERYFSPAVARAIALSWGSGLGGRRSGTRAVADSGPGAPMPDPWRGSSLTGRVEATVMFTDIRGFTRHTEQMEPEDVVAMLSDYVDLVSSTVFKHGGSVDKFLGDGILAVFGTPVAQPDHAGKALRAAEEIRCKLVDLNSTRLLHGQPVIQVSTALATGEIVTGTLGRGLQLAYTVVGDAVNLASRLVGLARPGEVLLTAATYEQALTIATSSIAGLPTFEGPFTIRVRGRDKPVSIYAATDPVTAHETPDETGFTLRQITTLRNA
ncbi:MAG: adenylate/guanylate cyclase domain-containing protein [Chloroflexia bacterium]